MIVPPKLIKSFQSHQMLFLKQGFFQLTLGTFDVHIVLFVI